MSGYELIHSEDLPDTPAELKKASHDIDFKTLKIITGIAADMTSESVWCGIVGRGLIHGNLQTQEYATELMLADGIDLAGIEWRVRLRAGRSNLLLANNVSQRYIVSRDVLEPPRGDNGVPLMSTDTLYRQLGHILDITASGAPVQIGITANESLGTMGKVCVDHLYTSPNMEVPITTMEGDAPAVLVADESAEELLRQSNTIATLPPAISRQIIENRWKELRP